MNEQWNPELERVEGELCEKGLLKERYDNASGELIRNITPEGNKAAEELLRNDKESLKIFLLLAKHEISKHPMEVQKVLWKDLKNQLEKIREKK